MLSFSLSSLICLLMFMMSAPTVCAKEDLKSQAENSKYEVYDAVLASMEFPREDPHILIADTTLNSGCGDKSDNPVRMNDCGIFAPASSFVAVRTALQQAMPRLEPSTWQDFMNANGASEKLGGVLRTPWQHLVADLAVARTGIWKSPDGIVLFSRVGFSKSGKQALVYVLFLSYMSHVATSGNVFVLATDASGKWALAGRMTYMESQ